MSQDRSPNTPLTIQYRPYMETMRNAPPPQNLNSIPTATQGFGTILPPINNNDYQNNIQIQRMNDTFQELEHRNNVLRLENENLSQDLQRAHVDLANYKETLKKFYVHYCEQSRKLDMLQNQTIDVSMQNQRQHENQYEMQNDVKNLILDRDLLINKFEISDKQYQYDIVSFTTQMSDKNQEIQDLRRRLNDMLEIKRKAEEEISSLRFTLDHQNTKLENELREKSLKLEQMDRQYADALYLKDRELGDAIEKIRGLEHEIRRLLDLNRNYAQELSMLARDNRFKTEEISRQQQVNPQTNHITIQSGALEPRLPPIWQQKLHDKIDQILNLYDKNHKRQLQDLAMNLWKCKVELRNRNKQNKSVLSDNRDLQERRGTPMLGKGSVDFRVSSVLCDGTITVLTFTRSNINNIIFEMFVRSVNHANQRKLNSFIIFILNLKELRQKYYKGLSLVLEVYSRLRKCLQQTMDYVLESKVQNGLYQKIQMATGQLIKHDMDFRDNINKWLEGTIAFTIQKKNSEKSEKNQEFLFLFRLLTIKYRIKYPLQGTTFKVDADIETFLEHKICQALTKVLKSQEPES